MPESSDQLDLIKETEMYCSMCAHLPIGFNRHFNMMACLLTYNARNSCDIDSGEIWKCFHSKYRQDRLNDLHKIPFPNDEMDFDLYECDDFKEMIDKKRKEESMKLEKESIEASDDNTLSGASTPVNTTPQLPSRKRKSTNATNETSNDKTQTSSSSRRRDRTDSERNDNKHSNRNRSDKDNKDDKNHHSFNNNSSTTSSLSKKIRTMPKRPSRNSSSGGGGQQNTNSGGNSTPRSSSSLSSSTTPSLSSSSSSTTTSSSTNKKNDKKIK